MVEARRDRPEDDEADDSEAHEESDPHAHQAVLPPRARASDGDLRGWCGAPRCPHKRRHGRAAGIGTGSPEERASRTRPLLDGPPRARAPHDHGGLAGHDPRHLRGDALTVRDEAERAREPRSGQRREERVHRRRNRYLGTCGNHPLDLSEKCRRPVEVADHGQRVDPVAMPHRARDRRLQEPEARWLRERVDEGQCERRDAQRG